MAKSVSEILRLVFTTSEGKSHSISCGDSKGYLEKFRGRKRISCGELIQSIAFPLPSL